MLEKVKQKIDQDIADKGGIIPFMADLMVKDFMKSEEGQAKFAELKKDFDKLFENKDG